jgi:RNA polymerase sigma-70 factor (ECF subfamily)
MESDAVLLEQFHRPETREAAFTAIMAKYQERLYWHIRRMVISHADADDRLQNVFIKVWNHLEDFQEHAGLYTWLYRIATNECLSFLEQQKRRSTTSLEGPEGGLAEKLRAEPGFDAQKLEWRLQEAILQLPEKQRTVFNLRYYEEMPYQEMSRILSTSEGALKASYHHAVKKIVSHIRGMAD